MITKSLTFRKILLAPLLMAFGLAGCTDKANPENVDHRSVERWNFLVAHQAEKAYDYLSPGFRTTQSREDYAAMMNNRALQWKNVKFASKDCDAERCKVNVSVTYSVVMPGAGGKPLESTTTQSETWILVEGEWFYLPK